MRALGLGLSARSRPPAWWPAGAVFAADFAEGRFMRGGAAATAAEAFSFSRASPAWGRKASGEIVAVAENQPRLTDLGLAVEEARARLTAAPADVGGAAWVTESAPVLAVLPPEGVFAAPLRIASDGQVFARRAANLSLVAGQAVHAKARYRAGSSPNFGLYMRSTAANVQSILQGPHGSLASASAAGGAWSNVVNTPLGGGLHEIDVDFTPNSTQSDWRLGVSPRSTVAGEHVDVLGAMVVDRPGWCEWLLGPPAAGTATAADAAVLAVPAGVRDILAVFDDGTSQSLPGQSVGATGWPLPAGLSRRPLRMLVAT